MTMLIVDGKVEPVDSGPGTLGELLARADARCAREGRIVTAVRIDGVDAPAFRDPEVAGRPLSSIQRVEIDSRTPVDLARRCLEEAGVALDHLAEGASLAARCLRTGGVSDGNEHLAVVTEGIAKVMAITGAVSRGLGVKLSDVPAPDGTLAGIAADASGHLQSLIAGHLAADWIAVADILDHDLAPLLRRWGRISRTLLLAPAPPVSALHDQCSRQ